MISSSDCVFGDSNFICDSLYMTSPAESRICGPQVSERAQTADRTNLGKSHVARLHRPLTSFIEGYVISQHACRFVERAVAVILGDTVLLKEVVLDRRQRADTTPISLTFNIRATSSVILSLSPSADFPTSCTISARSCSFCRISLVRARSSMKPALFFS